MHQQQSFGWPSLLDIVAPDKGNVLVTDDLCSLLDIAAPDECNVLVTDDLCCYFLFSLLMVRIVHS